jgi:hypothetical protein
MTALDAPLLSIERDPHTEHSLRLELLLYLQLYFHLVLKNGHVASLGFSLVEVHFEKLFNFSIILGIFQLIQKAASFIFYELVLLKLPFFFKCHNFIFKLSFLVLNA